MKDNGSKTNVMGEGLKLLRMVTRIKEATTTVSLTEEGFTPGQMVKYSMANGRTELKMATVFGKALQENPTSENGSTVKLRATVFTFGRTTTNMRESG
jgi:hypothetical protein